MSFSSLINFVKRYFPLFLLISYLILLLININNIPLYVGDERRYWESVQSLLDGYVDANNHPLLAKTIWLGTLSFFYVLTGTDLPLFWRFGTILFTILTPFIFYKVSRTFFSKQISLIATVILALDPMFFVFGRLLQLEIFAVFFTLLALFFLIKYVREKKSQVLYFGGLALGLSLSVKLSALAVLFLLPAYLVYLHIKDKKNPALIVKSLIIFMILTIFGFLLGNSIYLFYNGNLQDYLMYLTAVVKEQFWVYSETNKYQTSPPQSWFFIPQILSMYRINLQVSVESIIVLQNPATFIASAFAIILSIILHIRGKFQKNKEIGLLLVFLAGLFLPWFLNIRSGSYYYYILPMAPLIILLIINLFMVSKFKIRVLYIFLFINISVFALLYPLLIGIKVPKDYDLTVYRYSQITYPDINNLFCQNCYPRK